VELTLPWQGDLLDGMSATAVIPLYTKMEVLTVPVAALVEEKGGTVVYTALDPKTGELTAPVPVVTGVSDPERVEILEGLRSGDTVYYSYYDTLELDHTAKADRGGLF
jgi:multidrug efflux pump subunit AcrA (membrane-fusion protein)